MSEHALYEGTIHHHRAVRPEHRFSFRTQLPLLDLDHLDTAWDTHPLLGEERWRPLRHRRSDHLPGPAPLATAVRDLVEDRLGVRPDGRVRMLAQFRTWGWGFDPLTSYWCESSDGSPLAHVVEVTNTPWHERHAYVLDVRGSDQGWEVEVDKAMHVSPFLPMGLRHRICSDLPGRTLRITVDDHDQRGERVFSASIVLQRRPFDRAGLRRQLVRYPLASHRVTATIYLRALRLALRGARLHPHPTKSSSKEEPT